jgi:hypothetical protein
MNKDNKNKNTETIFKLLKTGSSNDKTIDVGLPSIVFDNIECPMASPQEKKKFYENN